VRLVAAVFCVLCDSSAFSLCACRLLRYFLFDYARLRWLALMRDAAARLALTAFSARLRSIAIQLR
jgi:hypothetical protein